MVRLAPAVLIAALLTACAGVSSGPPSGPGSGGSGSGPVPGHVPPLPTLGIRPPEGSGWHVAAPPPPGYDRAEDAIATFRTLTDLIAIDTQNPPGNEMRTARYFEALFEGVPGITTRVLDVGEGRANFVARLAAPNASAPPVLVLGHMDTVGAQADKWSTPPFVPTLKDGYLYGRGAIDDKGMLAAVSTALLALADQREHLGRDVILLATAAEEGGPNVGVDLVLEQHRELLGEPAFALNEGGRVRMREGRITSVNVQTTEKIPYNVKVTASGPSGHGSVPLPDNALAALARAVSRVHAWRSPVKLNETTHLFFAGLAEIETEPALARAMADLIGGDEAARTDAIQLLETHPPYNAVMRTGASLTLVDGGIRTNVIPSEGTANFNVRVLPNDDVREVVAAMQQVGAEPSVRFELSGEPRQPPPVSPVSTALYQAMQAATATMAPEAVVLPFMSTGATDGAALRRVGIPTYGILPYPMELEDELRMHGDDERVPVAALGWGTEFVYRVLRDVAVDA